MSEKIKVLKKDALVKLEIGAPFINRLQQLFIYIIKDIPKEKVQEYIDLMNEKKESEDEVFQQIITLSGLLHDIEAKADEQDLSYETDSDELIQPEN